MGFVKKILQKDKDFLFGLFLLTALIYATSWGGEFLSDDILGIQYNTSLLDLARQIKTLNINNILNSLIYKTFGPKPLPYHIVNTVIHLLTVILVYILSFLLLYFQNQTHMRAFLKTKTVNLWIPRITALLFALHPIETEGVSWISGLPYNFYTFFLVLALGFFILPFVLEFARQNKNKKVSSSRSLKLGALGSWSKYKYLGLSIFFFILALSSSEKAIVFPLILFSFVFLFCEKKKKNFVFTIPAFIIAGLYGLSRILDIGRRIEYVSPSYAGGPTLYNPLVQIPIAVYSYIKLIFLPFNLTLYHEFVAFPRWEYYLAVAVTVLFFAVIAVSVWKKGKLVAFGLVWFIVSLAPTLLPINIAWIVAERYVHFGTIGFFMAISVVIYTAAKKIGFKKYLKDSAFAFAVILSILTIKRNLEWRSQDTLWPATVRESPYSAYAWNNMGDYYGRHGDIENSIKAFERARQLRPRYAEATHNLGNTYLQIGEATKAAELFKEALEYNPNLYQSYENLGKIAIEEKDYKKAQLFFSKAIKLNPNPFADYLNLYIAYDHAGNTNKAEETLSVARRLAGSDPQKTQIIQNLILKLKEEKGENSEDL